MVKQGERVPAIEPEGVMRNSPTVRTTARNAAASRWRLDHPERELIYGISGSNGPVIIDTSEDPIDHQTLPLPESPTQTVADPEEAGQAESEDAGGGPGH